jgi:hypothetical protein
MISGQIAQGAAIGHYRGFEAGHIFPQARLSEWNDRGFRNFITDPSAARLISSSKIHSPQNGILLAETLHTLFDSYQISIDPDVSNLTARQASDAKLPFRETTGLSVSSLMILTLTVAPSV